MIGLSFDKDHGSWLASQAQPLFVNGHDTGLAPLNQPDDLPFAKPQFFQSMLPVVRADNFDDPTVLTFVQQFYGKYFRHDA